MPLLFRDFRPIAGELAVAVSPRCKNSGQMISSILKYVRDDTLRSAAELVEWKSDLTPEEIAKLLRELADGTRV